MERRMAMDKRAFLGIDTSCYVTSAALIDENLKLIADERRPLEVAPGARGLRQQEAVFIHIKNLSGVMEALMGQMDSDFSLSGVGVSIAPRPREDSYMPVFKVGEMLGRSIASSLRIPFVPLNHQGGHISAGLWSATGPSDEEFLALHVSGGTTELLHVARVLESIQVLELLGSSLDLHAGQFVDRVGLAMGLPFPAGPELERLSSRGDPGVISIPSSVRGMDMSFSGPTTRAIRELEAGADPQDVAAGVLRCIANTLEKVIRNAMAATGLDSVLLVGGVMANQRIRQRLIHRLGGAIRLYFAEPHYSGDNAVGIALETAHRIMN